MYQLVVLKGNGHLWFAVVCCVFPHQSKLKTQHCIGLPLGILPAGEEWKFVKQSDLDVISVYNTSFLQLDLKVNSAHSKPQ